MESKQIEWWVYLVSCSDGSLYTGIKKGAKYTRNKRPVRLVYSEAQSDRSTASKREYFIKKLSRDEKLKLIKKEP